MIYLIRNEVDRWYILIRKKAACAKDHRITSFSDDHVAVYGTSELKTDGVHGYPIEIAEIQD